MNDLDFNLYSLKAMQEENSLLDTTFENSTCPSKHAFILLLYNTTRIHKRVQIFYSPCTQEYIKDFKVSTLPALTCQGDRFI